MKNRIKILLISTIINKNLKRAIEDVRNYCDVRLICAHEIHYFDKGEIQRLVDWADLILLDMRGDQGILNEIDLKEKDLICLVGGGTLLARAKLGKFRMPAKVASSFISDPASLKKKIESIQKALETAGKILPFGVLRDARNYVRTLRYWANGGYENYRNMFLHLCRAKGMDLEVKDPVEFPDYGFYHPKYGFDYKPPKGSKKIGILFYGGMHFETCKKTLDKIVERLESMNFSVVPVYTEGILNLKALELMEDVDAIISLLWFRLNGGPLGGDPRNTIELLKKKRAKLFTPALMYSQRLIDWEKEQRGLNMVNLFASVTLPEMDGAVEPIALCGIYEDEVIPIADRVERLCERVGKWIDLRHKPNSEKRVAIVIYNYPPGEENLGNAAYLDTFESLKVILNRLKSEGYRVETNDIKELFLVKKLFNPKLFSEKAIDCPRLSKDDYIRFFNELPEEARKEIIESFGEPPGDIMVDEDGILIPVIQLGNVAVGVQPSRRRVLEKSEDLLSAIHDKTRPPHHQYLAFYFWLKNVFRADAIIHLGTHGTLEFMKGKEAGMSSKCYPDILISSIPHIYVYHVTNVSEAMIAKRRSYATLISYNSPPYTTADLYEDYARLEELIEDLRMEKSLGKAEALKGRILELAEKLGLEADLDKIEAKIYEFKRSIIPKGLHVIGKKYGPQELRDFMILLARYDRAGMKSLYRLIAEEKGLEYEKIAENPKIMKMIDEEAKKVVEEFLSGNARKEFREALEYIYDIAEKFSDNSLELENLLKALNGEYIEPSVGGDVMRNPEVLPTGRNLYQFDPLRIPTEFAVERGRKTAREMIEIYRRKHGKYPESVAFVLWGFETAQTFGETVAQIFELLGVELIHKTAWEKEIRVRSPEELGRPRIDVVVTICGFFRDMFPNLIELIDKAIRLVSELSESEDFNFVKKHGKELKSQLRIFGPMPTEYGTRMLQLVEDSAWHNESDLANAYVSSMCYAYGKDVHGIEARDVFENLLKTVDMVSQVRSSIDYEITDLDHYYEFFGGLSKAVELARGKKAEMIIVDSTKEFARVESVKDSIERGTITRTLNPKWIEEMLKHGFNGVQKIADRIEYLLGLAATTNAVENRLWDKIAERFVLDEDLFRRMKEANIYAVREILEKLLEAERRGYWKAGEIRKKIEEKYLEIDGILEEVVE
uniref:Magnesium chelatase subunit H n=1 Tax=Archaeoglobus fulgidus TaxID=2234 RepID=A0A7J2TJN4_ARCFL